MISMSCIKEKSHGYSAFLIAMPSIDTHLPLLITIENVQKKAIRSCKNKNLQAHNFVFITSREAGQVILLFRVCTVV